MIHFFTLPPAGCSGQALVFDRMEVERRIFAFQPSLSLDANFKCLKSPNRLHAKI